MTTFQGAMTAIVTPFNADGTVDFEALAKLVERQIAAGIDGIVSVGTTGESATLDVNEHVSVIKKTVDVVRGRVPVIAGAGANATREAVALSVASTEAGADGLLHVCPYYNKPTQEGLVAHFATIAGESTLPIVLYNVPGRTSCDLSVASVEILADLPSIVAIKDATGDCSRGSEIIGACGDKIDVLSGDDFTAFPLYSLGSKGVISVISNLTPAWVAQTWDAVVAGDWETARSLHYKMYPLVEMLFEESNPVPAKAGLAGLGHCSDHVRLPLTRCTEDLSTKIISWLTSKGVV